ncbi:MAG: lysophospholipase [Thermodesulfobacteriota bacterium]
MIHREGFFKGVADFNIFYQCWLPEEKPLAVLLIAHGFAEHSGRYGNLVNYFVPKGYALYALDHRGHGRSDGERVRIEKFTDYLKDLKTFFDLVRRERPEEKIFLVGHSMGAAISTAYVIRQQQELAGLILSGGGIVTPDMPPQPPRPVGQPLDTAFISRDPAVITAYENDPLVFRGPIPENSAITQSRNDLAEQVAQIQLPILIMAGNDPLVTDGIRSRALFERIGSKDKTLKLYDRLRHEIFNEPEYKEVLADMEEWLTGHL